MAGTLTTIPAAAARSDIVGKLGHIEEFVGILERVVEPNEHNVRAGADIRRDRGLGPDFTDEVRGAWVAAYGALSGVMIAAADEKRDAA